MPCNSDYLESSSFEKGISKVCCLLDELKGCPINPSHWRGYHPKVYGVSVPKKLADELVAELCSQLQTRDVSTLSLEAQIWWRDHQIADQNRLQNEVTQKKTS